MQTTFVPTVDSNMDADFKDNTKLQIDSANYTSLSTVYVTKHLLYTLKTTKGTRSFELTATPNIENSRN